ncbi:putative molybdenum carrier protein [Allorhodopirellula solitaria]|uniref:Putative molybdenum carrier n=1 Tax=Allorhodopirellula solitaria TaxID=2527987 RepID=A0A5C5X0E2_9BACT|nr:putative molybdenum carrier protein [Allorhodopirellula solitaria]TWT56614.1 putative molybdenum carrier [Allorhodopirellula solitaria]
MSSSSLFAEFDPTPERFLPARIVSGGQTGVDRGALDAAMALGIEHGGWCPAGRLAEDGRVPARYQLVEIGSKYYPDRTEKNVRDSDATLILYRGRMSGGTKLTRRLCREVNRPELSVSITKPSQAKEKIVFWLNQLRPTVLNVAGPRESNAPGIQDETYALLVDALG